MMKEDYKLKNEDLLIIKEKGRLRQVEISEITHIVADGHITTVKTLNKKAYSSYKLLKDYEQELNNSSFFRSNRNTLVNLRNMNEYKNYGKPLILLKNGETISISRRKLPEFNKLIG